MIVNTRLGTTGRLGNQLWEIASTVGLARKYNTEPWFNYWEYTRFFNVNPYWFAKKGEPVTAGQDVYTLGDVQHMGDHKWYLQDYSLFKNDVDEVRRMFEPSITAEEQLARPDLAEFWELPEPKLALHVRRGDNASARERNEQGFHPLRPSEYYVDAMHQLDGYASIAVFSDDLRWCREKIPALCNVFGISEPIYYFEGGPARSREHEDRYLVEPVRDWIDLLAMATCDRFILSNSTYSWWAAFLSGVDGSMIRYPDASVWFGPRLQSIDASLMFPPDWVPVLHPQA